MNTLFIIKLEFDNPEKMKTEKYLVSREISTSVFTF